MSNKLFDNHFVKSLAVLAGIAASGYAGVAATQRAEPSFNLKSIEDQKTTLEEIDSTSTKGLEKKFQIILDDGKGELKISCPKNSFYNSGKCKELGKGKIETIVKK